MITISKRVGLNANNHHEDVKKIQNLLNENCHLSGHQEIKDDSYIGPKTISAIKLFQREVLKLSNPDGTIDPNGKTITTLNEGAIGENNFAALPPRVVDVLPVTTQKSQTRTFMFPLTTRPQSNYSGDRKGKRYFGAKRKTNKHGKRLHAGCDLMAAPGTPVYAVEKGTIKRFSKFVDPTYQLIIESEKGGFIVRYCELFNKLEGGLKVGSSVEKGQLIATIGKMPKGGSMLHFELYTGEGKGNLTDRKRQPYQRRADLIDPTDYLNKATFPS